MVATPQSHMITSGAFPLQEFLVNTGARTLQELFLHMAFWMPSVLKTFVLLVEHRDASGFSLSCANVSANFP